jgi:hypothetical protein
MFAELSTDFKKGAFTALGVIAVILILSMLLGKGR